MNSELRIYIFARRTQLPAVSHKNKTIGTRVTKIHVFRWGVDEIANIFTFVGLASPYIFYSKRLAPQNILIDIYHGCNLFR